MITLNVFFHVKSDKKADFLKVLRNMVTESNKEDGCHHYQLWQNEADVSRYVLTEHWQDRHALLKHQQTRHWIAFNDVVNSYLESNYDEHHYQEIAR